MPSALDVQHGGAGYQAAQEAMVKHAVAWARKPRGNDGPAINDPVIRRVLAKAAIHNEVAEVLCRRQIWADVGNIHEIRSEERRVGKEGVSTGRSRGSPSH